MVFCSNLIDFAFKQKTAANMHGQMILEMYSSLELSTDVCL